MSEELELPLEEEVEEQDQEVTMGQLENWLRVRKMRLRITFEPGKSQLPLGRQLKKRMAAFDLSRDR